MSKDVDHILAQCKTCEKFATSKTPAKLVILRSDGKPYEQWAIDVIGPMPSNTTGCKFIITAVDFCTRWPVAQAVEHHDGRNSMEIHWKRNHIQVLEHLNASLLTVDVNSSARPWRTILTISLTKIKHLTTTPYHAQANVQVE